MSKASDKANKKRRVQKKKAALKRKLTEETPSPAVGKSIGVIPEKIISESKIKKGFLRSIFFKITVFVTIISIPTYLFWFKDKIHEWITPNNILYKEENTIPGIFIPHYILDTSKYLNIGYGSFLIGYPIELFKKGVNVTPNFLICKEGGEPMGDVKFIINNNRLYVSAEIRDLKTEEIIGIIDYNHWSLI
jgi:hypothetical protein